jgi:hypothetical protein
MVGREHELARLRAVFGEAARPLRSLLGETEEAASAEEIAWGFRKLLERQAQAEHLVWQGDAYADLAEVLRAAPGRREEARKALEQALDRYDRKQVIPLARRTRERLAALQRA